MYCLGRLTYDRRFRNQCDYWILILASDCYLTFCTDDLFYCLLNYTALFSYDLKTE